MPFLIRQILITLLRKFVHLQSFTLSLVCRINQVLLAFQRFLSPPRHRTAKDYSRGTSTLFYGSSNDYSQLSNVNTSTLTIIHPSYDVLVSKNEPFCLFSAVQIQYQSYHRDLRNLQVSLEVYLIFRESSNLRMEENQMNLLTPTTSWCQLSCYTRWSFKSSA